MKEPLDGTHNDHETILTGPLGIAVDGTKDRLTRELVESVIAGAADIGLATRAVGRGDDQTGLEALLGIGYQGSFLRVFSSRPVCRRVIWVGEPILPQDEAEGSVLARIARSSMMEGLKYPLRPLKYLPLPGPLARARSEATLQRMRARNARHLGALARRVDRVVVTSRDRQSALEGRGLAAVAIPFGYSASMAGPLLPPDQGVRDLVFVSLATRHRRLAEHRSIFDRWREDEPRLVSINDTWGAERGALLRRTRVVLNVAQAPGDFGGVRLVLALAAGAVVISEPMTDPYPFVAGVHFVEAPRDALLQAARDLVDDEPRRRSIAAAGQRLLAGELAMASCLRRVLRF
jgi:hypothetical protein